MRFGVSRYPAQTFQNFGHECFPNTGMCSGNFGNPICSTISVAVSDLLLHSKSWEKIAPLGSGLFVVCGQGDGRPARSDVLDGRFSA